MTACDGRGVSWPPWGAEAGGAVVTNPALPLLPGLWGFFGLMNEPQKITDFCCARSVLFWIVYC